MIHYTALLIVFAIGYYRDVAHELQNKTVDWRAELLDCKIPGSFFTPSTWGTYSPTPTLNWATWRSLFCHSPSGCSCATYCWRSWTSFIDSGPPIFSNFLIIMGTCLCKRNLFISHQFTTLREIPTGTLKADRQRKRGGIQFFCKDLLMLGIFKALWRKCLNYPGTTISKRCPGARGAEQMRRSSTGGGSKGQNSIWKEHFNQYTVYIHILDSFLKWRALNLTVAKYSSNQLKNMLIPQQRPLSSKEATLDNKKGPFWRNWNGLLPMFKKQVVFWNE